MMHFHLSDLNNHGVNLLKKNKDRAAISTFTKAMYHAKNLLDDQEALETSCHEGSLRISTKCSITSIPFFDVSKTWACRTSPHNIFPLYERAFAFHSRCDLRNDHVLFNAVLLYNIGLAHHRLGLMQLKESDKNLQQALRFYKCGLSVVRQNALQASSGENYFILVLAFLNNMGHIFSHFFRDDEAASCRDHLDVLLETVPIDLREEDSEFFHLSKLYRSAGSCNIAAPAA